MANEKRLIDANAFASGWMLAKFTEINGKMRLIRTMRLQDAPTVDAVEVVHGRWKEPYLLYIVCSECGTGYVKYETYNYCPNCGAKMDGGADA